MGEQPRRADGDARIARRRRHPQMKRAVALLGLRKPCLVEMFEHPHVADRVQRHAAGQHQPVGAGYAQQMIGHVDHGVFEHELGRGRLVQTI